MLSRRQIRIKVMQALYAFGQSDSQDLGRGEKDLFASIDKVYEIYLYLLQLFTEFSEFSRIGLADAMQKHLPDEDGLDVSRRFVENQVLQLLVINSDLISKTKSKKISWQKNIDIAKKLYTIVRKSDEYREYINAPETSFKADQDFIIWIFKKVIASNEVLEHHLEEKSIYWADDKDFVNSMVIKTLKSFTEISSEHHALLPLYKDEEDDMHFTRHLFRKTIVDGPSFEDTIAEKTANWDVERIAMTDIILMKMTLAEILNFSGIPVKVSINEYIDISKDYSTPKSKMFINGIIDKLVDDLKSENKIKKTGRGLLDV
jgi:N utilization substance protein B